MSTESHRRQMCMVAFLQAQNCSNYPASWRHPEAASDFMSPAYYQRIARVLEDARFHLAFFDDRLAIPDMYQHDHASTVKHGIRSVKLDPVLVAQVMGLATTHLGIGCTYSTTYYEPFHVARVFATLDLLLSGRAAWNVVTSLNDSEALNFGQASHLGHDERYDRADEFMQVVLGHWATWADDAIVMDRASGLFAHPDKVRALHHEGRFFKSKGPFTVPRSPQGQPILMQAGQSGRGREFAARWGEMVFALYPTLEIGRKIYRDFKAQVAAIGRNPDDVKVAPAIYVVAAPSQAMAEDKMALIDSLALPEDSFVLLSEVLNFDFGAKPVDQPFTDAEMSSISGLQAMRDKVVTLSGKRNPTPADFVTFSGRGTVREVPAFVGTPQRIADQLEEWFADACDGFVVAATHVPGAYEDFARLVVPELQRRGVFHREYASPTLRGSLGIGSMVRAGAPAFP
jgi:FMN-dependent oxidoreductase (nitrilotriacetate monooxygenase family)